MPTFAYQARDKSGQRVSGTREAPDRQSALVELREIGLYVTQIDAVRRALRGARRPEPSAPRPPAPPQIVLEVGPAPVAVEAVAVESAASAVPNLSPEAIGRNGAARELGPLSEVVPQPLGQEAGTAVPPAPIQPWLRANAKEMALFYRQMNSMLNAGTSISQALATMSSCASNSGLRRACAEMSTRTAKGQPWSETLTAYPGLFSKLAIGMISAGELGGYLDRMCARLSDYAERDYNIQQNIKRETWYPKLLVFCSILIPSAVPLVVTWAMGTGNPLVAWLKSVLFPLTLVAIVWGGWKLINYLSPVALHSGPVRQTLDRLKLYVPVMGKTARALATAKFCRALGALYASGMGLNRTLSLAADTAGNLALAEDVRRIIPRVENGESLSECLGSTGFFSPIVLQMMRTGEMSGNLDGQLDKVADFLEEDAETTIKQSVKVLGVLLFLLIAIYIGMTVVQFYTGYFNSLLDSDLTKG